MTLRIPLGIDDFRKLRESGLTYVDKTRLVCDVLDQPGIHVLLLPRPRRFGKSLNLSMLRCFFERSDEDLSHLFEGLAVWQTGEAYRAHFQRYPVIYLDFKNVTYERFDDAWWTVRETLRDLYKTHRTVLDSGTLSALETERFRGILDGSAPPHLYERALLDLSAYLHHHHGERVVVLIDEYDQPIHAGHAHGYARETAGFLDTFLGSGLKGNPHLHRAVLTGVVRVAPGSIFSGVQQPGRLQPAQAGVLGRVRLHRRRGRGSAGARGPLGLVARGAGLVRRLRLRRTRRLRSAVGDELPAVGRRAKAVPAGDQLQRPRQPDPAPPRPARRPAPARVRGPAGWRGPGAHRGRERRARRSHA
jgi:Predicted AAA-ATPase